ncbi:hypothetical protein [Planifilum fimeticola]
MIHQDPKNPICPKQLKQLQKKALQRGIMITFVAVGLLSLWLCIAHQFGWLTGGVTRTTAAWIGQMTPAVSAWLMHRIGQGEGTFYGFRRPTLKWLFWGWILGIGLPSAAFGVTGMFGWGSFASSWSDVMENIREQGFVSLSSDCVRFTCLCAILFICCSIVVDLLCFGRGDRLEGVSFIVAARFWPSKSITPLRLALVRVAHSTGFGRAGLPRPSGGRIASRVSIYNRSGCYTGTSSIVIPKCLDSISCHGTFNAQMAGPAAVLVSASSPVTGGFMGVAGILVIWPIALWLLWKQ